MQSSSNEHLYRETFAVPAHILVATDLNDGKSLIPHAIAQAKACCASVILVHAILPSDTLPYTAGAVPYVVPARVDQDVDQALEEMASQIIKEGIECEVVSRHGFASEVIQEQIERTGAARLIMASHGRGKLGQFLMGSVANQLLGTMTIPIFAVGPRCSDASRHAVPRHILHPVSLRGDYQTRTMIAIELAKGFGADLTLLHVPDREEEESIHPGHTIAWAENLFARLVPGGLPAEPPIHISVGFGDPVEHIRNEAERINADWIVMGVDEESHMWPLKESTAYRVMTHADCPVLAIPHEPAHVATTEAAEIGTGRHAYIG